MPHLINSETGKVYPLPPSSDDNDGINLMAWSAMVTLIDQGRARYDPADDMLQLVHG